MHRFLFSLLSCAISLGLLTACVGPDGTDLEERRQAVRDMRVETLNKLYRLYPQAREEIERAVGYGVFSNVGVNVVFVSAGNGYGVVRDRRTGKDTFMKMVSGGLGVGLGVKDFRGVFIFTTRDALEGFVNDGWDASGQADATAKSSDKGAAHGVALEMAPGIELYQITETGLALQATVQGTKYWRDDDLR